MDKSLNSQFIVVLDGIICDNSLLVLKMRFQVFSFSSKKVQGFSSDRKILMSLSVFFHLENCLTFLKFKVLAKMFGEMFKALSTSFPTEL